jgi:DNA gyrase subunit A
VTDKNGPVVGCMQVGADDDLMLITDGGMVIRIKVHEISLLGRDTQGVRLINLKEDEKVVGLARLLEREDEDEEDDEPEEQAAGEARTSALDDLLERAEADQAESESEDESGSDGGAGED